MKFALMTRNLVMEPDIVDVAATKKKYNFGVSFSIFCGIMI